MSNGAAFIVMIVAVGLGFGLAWAGRESGLSPALRNRLVRVGGVLGVFGVLVGLGAGELEVWQRTRNWKEMLGGLAPGMGMLLIFLAAAMPNKPLGPIGRRVLLGFVVVWLLLSCASTWAQSGVSGLASAGLSVLGFAALVALFAYTAPALDRWADKRWRDRGRDNGRWWKV